MFLFEDFTLIVIVALFYGWLYSRMPKDSFGFANILDPYYFSFSTTSTVGYGDFFPRTTGSKLLVMSQQMLVMTGMVALLSTRLLNK